MSFQNSLAFPFPAVQYIPLPITDLMQGHINQANPQNVSPKLIAGNDLTTWESTLERDYGLRLPVNLNVLGSTCPILALNLQISTVKYRGFFITMVGAYSPGQYQLFTIPTQRLYKSQLMIELFEQTSGKRLIHQNLFWPPKPIPQRMARVSR